MSYIKSKVAILHVLADKLREQGFVVILLLVFGYLTWGQNNACNEQREEQYKEQIELLKTIIQDNTKALDQNSRVLEKILNS
jgi:hypothetical protein